MKLFLHFSHHMLLYWIMISLIFVSGKYMATVASLLVVDAYAVIWTTFHLDHLLTLSHKKVHMLLMFVLDPIITVNNDNLSK